MKVTVTIPSGFQRATEASVKRALSALGMLARDRMTALAQEKLKSTAQQYIQSISTPNVSGNTATLTLNGLLANMMEKGAPPYDLKKMLRGRPYVDVAFKHGAPGSGRAPMPKAEFSIMGALAKAAKGAMVRGPRNMPTPPMRKQTALGSYQQKESKYGSMLRLTHTYKGATQATYLTIRRISKKSDPASWIHPGFKAIGIFPLVAKEVRKLAPRVIADYVREGLK